MDVKQTTLTLAGVVLVGVVAAQMGLVESLEALVDFLNTLIDVIEGLSEMGGS